MAKAPILLNIRQTTPFDVLNTDCMYHLYGFLTPLDIAAASEAIDSLFRFSSEYIYPKQFELKFQQFRGSLETERDELNILLKHYGPYLTYFSFDPTWLMSPCMEYLRAIVRGCPNLDEIRLLDFALSANDIESLFKKDQSQSFRLGIFYDLNGWSFLCKKESHLSTLIVFGSGVVGGIKVNFEESFHCMEQLPLTRCNNYDGLLIDDVKITENTQKSITLYRKPLGIAQKVVRLKISAKKSETPTRLLHDLKQLKYSQLINRPFSNNNESIFKQDSLKKLEKLGLDKCDNNWLKAAAQVQSLRELSIRQPYECIKPVIFETVSRLRHLTLLQLSDCSNWSNEDTIRVLTINHSIEAITLKYCMKSYQKKNFPSVPMIVDFLTKQKADFARPTVEMRIINDFEINNTVRDIKLLRDKRHLLRVFFIEMPRSCALKMPNGKPCDWH